MVLLLAPEKRPGTPSISSLRSSSPDSSQPLLPSHTNGRAVNRKQVRKYVMLNLAIVGAFTMIWLAWRWNEEHEPRWGPGGMGGGPGGPGHGKGRGKGGWGKGKGKVDRLRWKQVRYEQLVLYVLFIHFSTCFPE